MTTFAEQTQAAVAAHGQWKVRLRQAISTGSSEFKVETVKQDNQCPFGKWLYGEGRTSFPAGTEWERVRQLHAAFHHEAAKVLALAVSHREKEAAAALELGSPFSKASSGLVSELSRAQRAA